MTDDDNAVLIACPRCGIHVSAQILARGKANWTSSNGESVRSKFVRCTNNECKKEFLVDSYFSFGAMSEIKPLEVFSKIGDEKISWNICYPIEHIENCPEHLPKNVEIAYKEGTLALIHGLPNAAGTMFRKIIELATKDSSLIKEVPLDSQEKYLKQSFYGRIEILKKLGVVTNQIFKLANVIRLEGNSATHDSNNITIEDAKKIKIFLDAFLSMHFSIQHDAGLVLAKHINR